ncbi:ABATE domain-containing protein [Plantactinospora sp. B6F1]|uniref:CGNR zinc finger domain-containing protein n=1 Tax=Plantactinospora sp. B6F1 TaxID=3158971 RepID=UPI0032D903A0
MQAFINTFDVEDDEDDLTDPAALTAWLRDRNLLDGTAQADGADLDRARALREALRDLVAVHNRLPANVDAATDEVNRATARARLAPRIDAAGSSQLVPQTHGVDAALGKIIAAVHRAINDGTWVRLKACERGHCRWTFYDASRNRSGRWCSMAVCGSREKSQRAYRRGRIPGR